MNKEAKKIKQYTAKIINKEGFYKEMLVREPQPYIKLANYSEVTINSYLQNDVVMSAFPNTEFTMYELDRELSFEDNLIYREV